MIHHPPTALPQLLLHDEEMQRALATHDFGTVFRLARTRAGISYSKLAAECDIKPERVGTLAKGQGRITTFDKIVQIADALRVPGHMVGLAPRPWESDALPAHTYDPQNGSSSVRRRTVLQAATSTGLAAALPDLQRPPTPRRISVSTVARMRRRTARLRRLDDILGGGDTYRAYLGEYQATKAALRTAAFTPESRRQLVALLAEQAQQAGWAAFDGGRSTQAASLYEESKLAAREAGDTDLLGNGLAFLAYQTADHKTAVQIAASSCATITSATPTGVRALLHERMAWACAVADQPRRAEQALEAAHAALEEQQQGEPGPDWAAWVDHTELDIMTGRVWTELRRPLRAVPLLTNALTRYDDRHARDKALYLSWLATAYLTAGEIEEAAAVTGRALDLAAGVASVRPRQRLDLVLAQLRQHQDLSTVRAVLEKAAD
ncbi:helix-turn-helix transcriptional regulator [Streptomyces sp. SID161]|uniref:helix-turn-helix domain-containing protein n=1 Tax=Streptomyces sp. SID161 TaxID=2690251 RepID=UPI001369D950|nr:helix-turn-helix transcriptional regulator [Streptomyces sp. SID161]MYW48898.1 XRE family transcriptional regulator [Streptomyces sp. SID161]